MTQAQTCGLLILHDCGDPHQMKTPKIELERNGTLYDVESISQSNTIQIKDPQLQSALSCESLNNFTLPSFPFISFQRIKASKTLTLFKCNRSLNIIPPTGSNRTNCSNYDIYYSPPHYNLTLTPPNCPIIELPLNSQSKSDDLFKLSSVEIFIEVRVTEDCRGCYIEGGQCNTDNEGKYCCTKGNNRSRVVLVIALVTSFAGIGVLVVIIYYFLGLLSLTKIICFWKKQTLTYQSVEAFIRNHGPLGIRRYSYSDIKKMTNTFKYKLGQGGYGGVYKGKLKDGRFVAVKVLKESKGNGEEFLNEVASISRTSHVNIVTLMGFCFEYSKRALIYEFVPNGSLEKFIYKDFSTNVDRQLAWETSNKIAVGIAHGLEYLHRGCNTRILHFDIKPHNILLDENFCPKISDFGLAKICSREESIISMTGARGTIGYMAPELFCRNFGGVSHKSDVYSYGMMVLEMIGGRKNIDVSVDRTSEIYFPHWIYKRLELDEELGLQGFNNKEDEDSVRKMIIVSLWCIQTNPSDRPSMSKVVDMLKGSLDFLQMPPKPFLSSPPRTPVDSSTTTILL
ncbi:hypothetical protein ACB092_05G176900 [Castanea dentata]